MKNKIRINQNLKSEVIRILIGTKILNQNLKAEF